nr:hypothetical protein [Piscibacillus salipiscarius]
MPDNKLAALIILDGFAFREEDHGNAVKLASTPNFDRYWNDYPHSTLKAFGEAVGLPEGQMGNSEVGHLNIGAGRIVYQNLTRINLSIKDREFHHNEAFVKASSHAKTNDGALHILDCYLMVGCIVILSIYLPYLKWQKSRKLKTSMFTHF